MKQIIQITRLSWAVILSVAMLALVQLPLVAETIDPNQKWAWGSNAGWIDFTPDLGGVVVYSDHLEGYAWGENTGWIKLGVHTGGGIHTYTNTAADNYGVNRSSTGRLSGFAWGTDIGWIDFAPAGWGVTIDPQTGVFDGYAWGENIGWIKFSGPGYGVIAAFANQYTVTNLNDGGAGSLRQAIIDANDNAGADTITFADGLAGTITLGSALPIITEELTISGTGSAALAVSGGGLYRVFESAAGVPLTISGLTLRDGYHSDNGGCLLPGGKLVLRRVVIANCHALRYGGGIHLYNSDLAAVDIAETSIYNNSAGADGGGISLYSERDVALNLVDCIVRNNSAGGNGGGLQVFSSARTATLTARAVQIHDNRASGAGGGFYAFGDLVTVDLTANVMLRRNTASVAGGGGYVDNPYVSVQGHTFFAASGGTVRENVAGTAGGGLYIAGSKLVTATLQTTAIYSNSANAGNGGGLAVKSSGDATVVLTATQIFSNATANGGMGGGGVAFEHNGVGTLAVATSEIRHNTAWGGYGLGGGIYMGGGASSTATLAATTIHSNTALGGGGGLAIVNSGDLTATLSATQVYSNVAGGAGGGGLYLYHGGDGRLSITDGAVHHNRAWWDTSAGGGIYMIGASGGASVVTLRSTPVHDNRAYGNGGGVSINAPVGMAAFSTDAAVGSNVAEQWGGGGFHVVGAQSTVDLLTGAAIYDNQAGSYGGGFYVDGMAGSIDLRAGVAIYDNVAGSAGGGGFVYGNAFNAVDGAIYGNRAGGGGGGIYVNRDHPRVQLTGMALYDNVAGNGWGGGLAVDSTATATVVLSATHFYSNSAIAGSGGGVTIRASDTITAALDEVTMTSNTADAYGGALYIDSPSRQNAVKIEASTLDGNHADFSGGGLYLANGALQINGGLIRANHTDQNGGGIFVQNGVVAVLTGAHILGNAAADGGGIYAQSADVHVTGGCIAGNSANAVANLVDASFLPVIATDNWWGVRNGPGGVGPGLGDAVTAYVDYTNFKTAPPVGCPDRSPVVGVTKQVTGIPMPGNVVTYTIVLTNSGPTTDPAVALDDVLPTPVNFLDWLVQPAGASFAADRLQWTGAVAASSAITFAFSAAFVGNFSAVVTNTAAFSATLGAGASTATFAAQHLLTVARDGVGAGAIASIPGGIACGADCMEPFTTGAVVTLTATPAEDSAFIGWSGACNGINPICVLLMNASQTATATFTLSQWPLTAIKSGDGQGNLNLNPPDVNCGAACTAISQTYANGVPVVLTAAPATDSVFGGWLGDCAAAGINPVCTVSMTAVRNVTASFARFVFPLAVRKTGSGAGLVTSGDGNINCGAACVLGYAPGTMVILTAQADAGSTFAGWSANCTVTPGGACTVTMDSAKEVEATFTLNNYSLSVGKAGSGSGRVDSSNGAIACGAACTATYPYGTAVTLTAQAASGSTFAGWSGACSGANPNAACQVTIAATTVATATFHRNRFVLRLTKTGSGLVNLDPPNTDCGLDCSVLEQTYDQGTAVALTAQPAAGFIFDGWGEACASFGTNPVCTLTMDAAQNATTSFAVQGPQLRVVKVGAGRVYGGPPGGVPAIDCEPTCQLTYNHGAAVTLYAVPGNGQVFAEWSGACTAAAPAPCVVILASDQVVTATFATPGSIAGTVTITGTASAQVNVTAERLTGAGWQWAADNWVVVDGTALAGAVADPPLTVTAQTAPYTLSGLAPGSYRIHFHDRNSQYQTRYYDDVTWDNPDAATIVAVMSGDTTGNVHATLPPPAPALAEISTQSGWGVVDPNTGQIVIAQLNGVPADIVVRVPLSYADEKRPISVTLEHGTNSFLMVEDPPGSKSYIATIPAANRLNNTEFVVVYVIDGQVRRLVVGRVELYDPSGIIADAGTGQPIRDAQVVLFHVPGWRPDTGAETRECRTVDTRSGPTWESEPAANPQLGAAMNTILDAERMSPTINPQRTDAAGRYGWDVAEGCYYIIVSAHGYEARVSPVVGVPPAVTDLDMKLTPLPQAARSLYLPIINR